MAKSELAEQAYMGALYVLEQKDNPDRISQSAHSIRELTSILSREGTMPAVTDKEDADEDTKENVLKHKLKSVFDPFTQAHAKLDIYKEWDKVHRLFIGIAHHGKLLLLSDYVELLRQLEALLLIVFDSQVASRLEFDSILEAGPASVDWNDLKKRLSRTLEEDRYFFNKADETWLAPLNTNIFFSKCPQAKEENGKETHPGWPEGEYLARIAASQPEQVMRIIEGCNTTPYDQSLNLNVAPIRLYLHKAKLCKIVRRLGMID